MHETASAGNIYEATHPNEIENIFSSRTPKNCVRGSMDDDGSSAI
jgi:hypothetical protein